MGFMSVYSERIKAFLDRASVDASFLEFPERVHTVDEAVEVSGYPVERFTKTIVMVAENDQIILAVVPASRRASTERVRKALALNQRPKIATGVQSETKLGQKLGGNTPINADGATIIIDPKVLEREWILVGGGDDRSLVKISVAELKRVVTFVEARVRK